MIKHRSHILLLFCLFFGILSGFAADNSTEANLRFGPKEDRVGFPDGYEMKFEVLRSIHRVESHEVVTVYGNPEAASVKMPAQLPYPNGAVLVMETSKAIEVDSLPKRDNKGDFQRGDIIKLHVMRKGDGFGIAYGENRSGDWEFAEYKSDGGYLTHPSVSSECSKCHIQAGSKSDFVYNARFTRDQFMPPVNTPKDDAGKK